MPSSLVLLLLNTMPIHNLVTRSPLCLGLCPECWVTEKDGAAACAVPPPLHNGLRCDDVELTMLWLLLDQLVAMGFSLVCHWISRSAGLLILFVTCYLTDHGILLEYLESGYRALLHSGSTPTCLASPREQPWVTIFHISGSCAMPQGN